MKKYIIPLLLLIILGSVIAWNTRDNLPLGGSIITNSFTGGVTNSTSSVSSNPPDTTTAQILDRNLQRQYAMICNASTTATVYLHFLAATTTSALLTTESGIPIGGTTSAEPCYEIDSTNLYKGRILGISTQTVQISTLEK